MNAAAAPRTTLTPERRDLCLQIATLAAGYRATDVAAALCDNLWQAAAALCRTPEEMERLLLELAQDMMRDARLNWQLVIEAKAQPRMEAGHA